MKALKICLLLSLFFALTLLADSSNSLGSQPYSQLQLDANRIPWSHLLLETKNVMVDVTVDIKMQSLSADEISASLIENKQGDAVPIPATGGYKMTSDTLLDAAFKDPVTIVNHVWFNPADATALGRIRLRQGEDHQKKVYRFTRQGVFRHRKEPIDKQEAKQDPEQWSDVVDTFYKYDLAQLGCTNVSERLLLVYIASTSEQLENDKPLSMCIFGKRQLFQVQLTSAGLESVEVDYVEKKGGNEKRRQGEVKAQKITLKSSPLKSDLEKVENFSFLGFQKDIAFFIDPTSKLPLQVSGYIPKGGNATLKLLEAELK